MITSRKSAISTTNYDQEGREIEFDVREDEEQGVKLTQTIDLLLAAGYFRARIKGLSAFDKVVGGMTWCITTCNFDLDVDLLFQENSTIGQKIALTEKIVAVLPRMKCPHRIEPHQIQGLDFIHIYPVVQWLVKRAIETREEMGDYIRAYSISQFNKHHAMPQDVQFKEEVKGKATSSVSVVKTAYRPQRRYRCADRGKIRDEATRVQTTLLEYGRHHGVLSTAGGEKDSKGQAEQSEEERARIDALMQGFSEEQGRLRGVGSIVGEHSESIQEMAEEYALKHQELTSATPGGQAAQHERQVTSLSRQLDQRTCARDAITEEHASARDQYVSLRDRLQQAEELSQRIDEESAKLEALETDENKHVLETLRALIAQNEALKQQEQKFKASCKEEMKRLQESIEKLKQDGGVEEEDQERRDLINQQYEANKQKLHKIRMLLARRTREIAALHRRIDEVPTRAELAQYQRRFVELYNQVAATHKETKQFYTLYNTLDDKKLYLDKEVNLLNSIHDNFTQAMSSEASKQDLLKQMQNIVQGVKANLDKLDKRVTEERKRRDELNAQHLQLLDEQRHYFKTVRDFQEECRKNEIIQSKLQRAA